MRYFAELAYNGTNYFGWQRQPNASSVQATIEDALSLILRAQITIVGCGRTDTGVHASQYFIHFDCSVDFPKGFLSRLNKYLPEDIAFYQIFPVSEITHARYDAFKRSYEYHICFRKTPFHTNICYHYPFAKQLDLEKMQAASHLLLNYKEFFPFCKTNTDVKTMRCDLQRAEWVYLEQEQKLIFHISANRFLRGMVRLIVGMCLNVGLGKIEIERVKKAMDEQSRLEKSLSAPAHGLFLTEIKYPFSEKL